MEIEEREYCPDSTYFRAGDVEPQVSDGKLVVYDGEGSRRGWGKPGNHTYVVVNNDELTSVVVGFYHKRGGGQFWRHYVNGQRKTWTQLSEDYQNEILKAYAVKAPHFAKSPGMLKSTRAKPIRKMERENCIGYKSLLVERDESGDVKSVRSPQRFTEWQHDDTGWTLAAQAVPSTENKCGIYITFKTPVARSYNGDLCKVMLSGRIVVGETGARGEFARILEGV